MNHTKIEWVKNPDGTPGFTWNPITGCLNHVNGLCKGGGFPCYAYRLATTRLKDRYCANKYTAPIVGNILLPNLGFVEMNPFYPRFWPERLKWHRLYSPNFGRGIFVCDMSDVFGIGIPEEWTWRVLEYINTEFEERFYLLTKQPQNLIKFSPFPDNCWVGVTATNCSMFAEAYWQLKRVKAKVKYLSLEPMLDFNKLPEILTQSHFLYFWLIDSGINWLIIGAQTKPSVYPKIEWVQEIVEAADKVGIPVFLKDNLLPLIGKIGNVKPCFTSIRENNPQSHSVVLRQEMPK